MAFATKGAEGIGGHPEFLPGAPQEWPHVAGLVRWIHARFPDVPIFLGGEHPTATWS